MESVIRRMEAKLRTDPNPRNQKIPELPKIIPRVIPNSEVSRLMFKMKQAKIINEQAKYTVSLADQEEMSQILLQNSVKKSNVYLISFEQYLKSKEQVHPKFGWLFTASTFAEFPKNEDGLMSIKAFHSYVTKVAALVDSYCGLHAYSATIQGYITAEELEQYILDIIPSLNLPVQSSNSFKYYVIAVMRKFRFFHDRYRQEKYKIEDILFSPVLAELLELRQEGIDPEDLEYNWFAASSIEKLYNDFQRLDLSRSGTLSRNEASGLHNGSLTKLFLDRVYLCVHLCKDGRMVNNFK
jgi:hypothetical protein